MPCPDHFSHRIRSVGRGKAYIRDLSHTPITGAALKFVDDPEDDFSKKAVAPCAAAAGGRAAGHRLRRHAHGRAGRPGKGGRIPADQCHGCRRVPGRPEQPVAHERTGDGCRLRAQGSRSDRRHRDYSICPSQPQRQGGCRPGSTVRPGLATDRNDQSGRGNRLGSRRCRPSKSRGDRCAAVDRALR